MHVFKVHVFKVNILPCTFCQKPFDHPIGFWLSTCSRFRGKWETIAHAQPGNRNIQHQQTAWSFTLLPFILGC